MITLIDSRPQLLNNCLHKYWKKIKLVKNEDLTPLFFENDEGFQLREETKSYIANFDAKNGNIGPKNAYF